MRPDIAGPRAVLSRETGCWGSHSQGQTRPPPFISKQASRHTPGQEPVASCSGVTIRNSGHYCRLSENHELCNRKPPSPEVCGRILGRTTNAKMRQRILYLHNSVRRQTAIGEMKGSDGFLPRAAGMLQLEWDDELAEIAQAHAEKCFFRHDCGDCKKTERFHGVGQNLGSGYTYNIAEVDKVTTSLMKEWYMEVNGYSKNEVKVFRDTSAGHFTQMVWGETEAIGCGLLGRERQMNGDPIIKIDLFCNYGTVGNSVDRPVYVEGTPCSDCPRGRRCSTEFPGLCSFPRK